MESAIAKELIDKHIKSQEVQRTSVEYAKLFRLNPKLEPEPTWFEIEQAAGEIPTDRALYLDNED